MFNLKYFLFSMLGILLIPSYSYNLNVGATGLMFPYTLGILAYIKTCIKPDNYTLTGISGGAWCSLIYHFEDEIHNHDVLWSILVGNKDKKVHLLRRKSMREFQSTVAENFKKRYALVDTTNIPISIIATRICDKNRSVHSVKINKFDNIDDLVNYCLCSSYIPIISGNGIWTTYKNQKYIDGELFKNKTLFHQDGLNVNKNTWNKKLRSRFFLDFRTSQDLFKTGWNDAAKHL